MYKKFKVSLKCGFLLICVKHNNYLIQPGKHMKYKFQTCCMKTTVWHPHQLEQKEQETLDNKTSIFFKWNTCEVLVFPGNGKISIFFLNF